MMTITITDIRIRKIVNDDSNLKAIVSVVLNECIAVHEIKIIQSKTKLFVAMPSRKDEASGTYRDIIHPIFPEFRNEFEKTILDAYERHLALSEIQENTD